MPSTWGLVRPFCPVPCRRKLAPVTATAILIEGGDLSRLGDRPGPRVPSRSMIRPIAPSQGLRATVRCEQTWGNLRNGGGEDDRSGWQAQ